MPKRGVLVVPLMPKSQRKNGEKEMRKLAAVVLSVLVAALIGGCISIG